MPEQSDVSEVEESGNSPLKKTVQKVTVTTTTTTTKTTRPHSLSKAIVRHRCHAS